MKETLAERNARYLAEGRTVSGGDGNGPGKPGYKVISLGGVSDAADTETLNYWADQGYEVVGFDSNRVILGNYKKD
jgi:hypothetical protein